MFATTLILALVAGVAYQDKITDAERAAIAGDPPFVSQKLRLVGVPKATGRAYPLFNGKDLNDW